MITMMTIRIYSVVVVRIEGILHIPVTVHPFKITASPTVSLIL